MNNEPVAHFYPEGEGCTVYDIKFAWKVTGTTEPIPLYTHPAKDYFEDKPQTEELFEIMESNEMNNEPVAWIDKNTGKPRMDGFIQTDYDIPLYTHPANPKYDPETGEPLIDGYPLFSGLPPAKTLTDEEILTLWMHKNHLLFEKDVIDFAQLILRKASEK
jgi:hypothetical protein